MAQTRRPRDDSSSRDSNETRARILAAGLRQFSEKGYTGAGMRDVAAAAGLTEGALYHYFKGKEDLLRAILEDRLDCLKFPGADNPAVAALFASLPLEQTLAHIADHMLHRWQQPEHVDFVRLMFGEALRDREIARLMVLCFQRPLRLMLEEVLRVNQEAGRIPADLDLGLLSRQVMATAVFPLMHQHLLGGRDIDPVDLKAYFTQAARVCLQGLSAKAP